MINNKLVIILMTTTIIPKKTMLDILLSVLKKMLMSCTKEFCEQKTDFSFLFYSLFLDDDDDRERLDIVFFLCVVVLVQLVAFTNDSLHRS